MNFELYVLCNKVHECIRDEILVVLVIVMMTIMMMNLMTYIMIMIMMKIETMSIKEILDT